MVTILIIYLIGVITSFTGLIIYLTNEEMLFDIRLVLFYSLASWFTVGILIYYYITGIIDKDKCNKLEKMRIEENDLKKHYQHLEKYKTVRCGYLPKKHQIKHIKEGRRK